MTYDKDKIRQSIQSMTAICDKGKAEVTKLVESIIGAELSEPIRLVLGGVYRNGTNDERTLVTLGDGRFVLVSLMRDMLGEAVQDEGWSWPLPEHDLRRYMAKNNYTIIPGRTIS